jgi:hypothetical protein
MRAIAATVTECFVVLAVVAVTALVAAAAVITPFELG